MSATTPASGVRTARLTAQGIETRVLEAGPVDRHEAVVMLHGSPGSADDWADLLPRLGELTRTVALDLPGFAEADKPRDFEYTPNSYATYFAAALNELGIARAHLVMNDIGGLGLFWASAHPQAFASAVLINSGQYVGYRWHLIAQLHRLPFAGQLVAFTGGIGFRAAMRLFEPRLPKEAVKRWRPNYDWGTRRAMLRFYRTSPIALFERIVPDLRRLDRPALVLWGARDRFVPVEQAERQRESFPSADVRVLDGLGHYPHVEDPQTVAEAVVPFVRTALGHSY
jgi:pimeloyl-ACP methyl ester carboxylesterase